MDAQHNLVVHAAVTSENDTYALSAVALAAKEVLQVEQMDALADRGYHTGADAHITTYVAPPSKAQNKQKEEGFGKEKFIYQADSDTYLCPSAVRLTTNGKWYNKRKDNEGNPIYRFKRYEAPTASCAACQFLGKCTNIHNGHGRYIERSEYDEQIEENRQRVLANKNYYRQRQAMVEHPFGTIKRSMGYSYTLLKTKPKVSGEFALIFTCYNLKRVINILGVKELIRRLNSLIFCLMGSSKIGNRSKDKNPFLFKKIGRIQLQIR